MYILLFLIYFKCVFYAYKCSNYIRCLHNKNIYQLELNFKIFCNQKEILFLDYMVITLQLLLMIAHMSNN